MKGNSKLGKAINFITSFSEEHEREIKLGLTITGVVLTGISAARAGIKASKILEKQRIKVDSLDESDEVSFQEAKKEITVDTVKKMAPVVLPPVIIGGATIFSAVSGYNAASKRLAALSAAYNISEKTLTEYTEKAKEMLGEKKTTAIKDEVQADKVKKNPPDEQKIIFTGKGETLCYDDYSGRYFFSDAETIRKVVNDINARLMDEYYISLNEFYDELGLPDIKLGSDLGFSMDDGLVSLSFSATLDKNDRPCLVLNYDVSPRYGHGDFR